MDDELHVGSARSKTIIVKRPKPEQMNLKFGKTIRTLRLSQNYLVLITKVYIDNYYNDLKF